MKSFLIFAINVLFFTSTEAKNFYFSSTIGDDSRSSQQATDLQTPWKSIEKLNSLFKDFHPGDSILLKRGDTFFGTINITQSGSASKHIVISAFGEGSNPIVTGFKKVEDWISKNNNIWESRDNLQINPTLNLLVSRNQIQSIGRYPNVNDPNAGYLKIDSHSGKFFLSSTETIPDENWIGADIVVRTSQYTIDRAIIIKNDTHSFTFGQGLTYESKEGYGFFLQNHLATLDEDGEWYYDAQSGKVNIYGRNNPGLVSVPSKSVLLSINSNSFIDVINISFRGSNKNALEIKGPASDISLFNCEVAFAGENGVIAKKVTNFSAENCDVHDILNSGIIASDNASISGCRVYNTGTIAGMTQNNAGIAAISNGGDGSITINNKVIRTGYIGIKFGGNNSTVKNNVVDSFCLIKQDGGGIYAQGRKGEKYIGTLITGNIVSNGIASSAGTTTTNNNSVGIYADDYLNNISILNNSVYKCGVGYLLHNNQNVKFLNNVAYANTRVQMQIRSDKPTSFPMTDIKVQQNILFSNTSSQLVLSINSLTEDVHDMADFEGNTYAIQADDSKNLVEWVVGRKKIKVSVSQLANFGSSQQVQQSTSLILTKRICSTSDIMVNSGDAVKKVQLKKNVTDIYGQILKSPIQLQPYASKIILEK